MLRRWGVLITGRYAVDIATIIGYILGLFCVIVIGVGLDKVGGFVDVPSAAIVFGGGLGACLISMPLENAINSIKVFMNIIFVKKQDEVELIQRIVEFAEIARRDGILALENVTDQLNDEFLIKGIQLAVDGTDPELIESILNTEIECIQARHNSGRAFFESFEKYAPGWGMIGTLIGLINMLSQGMDDPSVLTSGMAVALITTMYGSVISNFFVGPVSTKLQQRNSGEIMIKNIILRGVLSIQSGDNPRIVEMKLKIFLPPSGRNFGKDND